jgi:hypothetical protein
MQIFKRLVKEGAYLIIEGLKDNGLYNSEINSFNSRVSDKVISNDNGNALIIRIKFVYNIVRITHFIITSDSAALFPNPEIYSALYSRGLSPSSPIRMRMEGRLGSPQ